MRLTNTSTHYGGVAIILHWLCALMVFCLFGVGLWMVGFDYYNPLYKTVPHLHKSFGVVLISLMLIRFVGSLLQKKVYPLEQHKNWQVKLAKFVHYALYLLIFLMFPTGYLITTAKGQSLEVFNWFTIPALLTGIDNMADLAAQVHEMLAFSIIVIAGLHALGAFKHHFIDKDSTLVRMIKINLRPPNK